MIYFSMLMEMVFSPLNVRVICSLMATRMNSFRNASCPIDFLFV